MSISCWDTGEAYDVRMLFDLGVLLTTFLMILPAELPDKSFITSVVLASRFPRFAVWCGASAAFAIQVGIAVSAGQVLDLLPRALVLAVVTALFLFGAFVLLRMALRGGNDEEDIEVETKPKSWGRAAFTTFGLLFAAEWGDLTQLIAAAQSARTGSPLSVALGAWLALVTVSAVGVLVGSWVRERLHPRWLHLASGSIMAVLGVLAAVELLGNLT